MKYHISFEATPRQNPYSGLFIALEGIDGSGKTTQAKRLKEYYEKQGKKVITTHWPRRDEGLLAQLTTTMLQGKSNIPKAAFQYLFSADYILFSEDFIIPNLESGAVVITDRCHFWSAVAYGTWENSDTFDESIAESLLVAHGVLTKSYRFIIPDITLYLDLSPEVAVERLPQMKKTQEMYEKEDVLIKIQEGYRWLVRRFPEFFVTIDAERSIDEVSADMIEKIEKSRRESKNKTHR